jgi:hypothetical protein
MQSGNLSLSVALALGEDLTPSVPSTLFLKKPSFPSATLREEIWFIFKPSSPSATLGEEIRFFRKKSSSSSACPRHSGKKCPSFLLKSPSPSAAAHALGEENSWFSIKKSLLRESLLPALSGKPQPLLFCYFSFPSDQQSTYTQTTNQHRYVTNCIYKSQWTKYVRNPQYITNHTFKSTHYSKFTNAIHKMTLRVAHDNWEGWDVPTCDPGDALTGDGPTCDADDPSTWFDDTLECRDGFGCLEIRIIRIRIR